MNDQLSEDDNLTIVKNGNPADIAGYALVLSAMDIDYYIAEEGHSLLVSNKVSDRAIRQFAKYDLENLNWPPPQETVWYPPFYAPKVTYLFFTLMGLFYWYTGEWYPENTWFTAGAINRQEIFVNNQWWRLVTALTLHADIVHLFGNCIVGSHLILLLSKITGYGLCWFLVIISGTLGNLLNILLREGQHLSVGFSTSVFATLGIFIGLRLRLLSSSSLIEFLLPLGAGAGLLVFFGAEGARTDIGAHFFGFVVGIFAGILCNILELNKKTSSVAKQSFFLYSGLILLLMSWFFALQSVTNVTF